MSQLIEQQRFTCAIGGMQSVVAIPKAVPILHSGPGCGTMVSGFFERSTGYAGGSTAPCSNFTESEVVFGGEEKLTSIIQNTYKVLESELQVVLTGCTAAIVGDDVGQVARQFAREGKPIVYVETPGFKCTNYEAHSMVVNAIIDQFVDLHAAGEKVPDLVNLFASIPYQDPFWKGNLEALKRCIEGIGLKVNILFGPYSEGVAEWKRIPNAGFNVLVSSWAGLEIAEHLKEKYDQPFFHFPYLPIGGNETTRFLEALTQFAMEQGVKLDPSQGKAFIQRESLAFYEEIDNLATFLLEFRYGLPRFVHILHDASYVLGMSKFLLHEVGIIPKEQFITDKTPEQYQSQITALGEQISEKREIPIYFEPDAGLAQESIRKYTHEGRGLLIGSGWDKLLAEEKSYDFLSAGIPSPYRLALTTGYAGYSGGLRLIEDIYNTALASYQ